ncbi:MAG: aminodeoxychorismate/anthranilate synthase component II [Rhodospirillaceae bacterium]|nr:aminodeoxychorismate/anthranilate synthase component II [Rhodospirillaceae bacterium]MBT5455162.1 aminodeoxychorismate/anthranilate synthase component II [Rhodospirillaceae bacterium]
MLLIIDNYDSFTYNLVHFLGELGADADVRRNDALTAEQAVALNPDGIVLSPGPCDPDKAGICLDLVERAKDTIPILGVCLGHQSIAQALGARIVRADKPMHGKPSQMHHNGKGLFRGLPNPYAAIRYHSLVVDPASVPEALEITAQTDDGVIMGIAHKSLPVHGVQFHPESIDTEHGHRLLENFLDLTREWREAA